MGKPMYNFGKAANLKARQQKQMDKALKRRLAKQSKANMSVEQTEPRRSYRRNRRPMAEITAALILYLC